MQPMRLRLFSVFPNPEWPRVVHVDAHLQLRADTFRVLWWHRVAVNYPSLGQPNRLQYALLPI